MPAASLPIDAVLPQLLSALENQPGAVLEAEPGAGKTTRVPLALLQAQWLQGRIIMLEPRRLAARAAARYMAALLGEPVGRTVGYRVSLESKVSAATRIEVVTEGVLTRMIQDDPELSGVGLVIFDEFHERSLQGDLGLALALDVQGGLREDLRLLVMSATLEGDRVAALLGDAPIIRSRGRQHPVATRYLGRQADRPLEPQVVSAVLRALGEEDGSLLVFLPGMAEIRRVETRLAEALAKADVDIMPLHGSLPASAQDAAIRPPGAGRRKVVLATAIAETSLTIDGIRVVVDAGLSREPRFDPRSGMTRLQTRRVSRAGADQRRGRAGRLQAGVCYRLWSESEQDGLAPQRGAEILAADLAPLALELARWGVSDPAELDWLDPPPAAAYAQARDLLRLLGALDEQGRLTPHGEAMARHPLHPRLAHLLEQGRTLGLGALAAVLAAMLSERDLLRRQGEAADADLRHRLDLLLGLSHQPPAGHALDRATLARVKQLVQRLDRQALEQAPAQREACGELLALAYPERLAQCRQGGRSRYRLRNGRGAMLRDPALAGEAYLAVAEVEGGEREALIRLAAPLSEAQVCQVFAERIETVEHGGWNDQSEAVTAWREHRLDALVLSRERLDALDAQTALEGLLAGIRRLGLECLPWDRETASLRARAQWLQRHRPDAGWPDMSDDALLAELDDWLGPYLAGLRSRRQLREVDLLGAVKARIGWPRLAELERLTPERIGVPSGSRIRIDYGGEVPVLPVRLQELFGLTQTPAILDGAEPLLLHLLSPAGRPVQVTRDLASFWANTYAQVKKDLKGRYPKHYWPDDPLQAQPTSRAKPRR